MKWVVVDASVIIKAISQDNLQVKKKISSLLKKVEQDKTHLFAPPIFWAECANALRFSNKDKKENQNNLQKIFNLPIRLTQPTSKSIMRSLEISQQLGDTVYDSWYHVTALWLGAIFITADKKYYNKAKNIGSIEYWG
ncbi:type II toxin-antitoxin system VapC family toxin [Patescibacteria group bacterium]|nr:type II toxin-antitoxin system VapC family toxin [Patescibacteria group bacterium]MBU1885497.1 type II toxin-antitoxin system VapC family toxin [Patescibacteria group bacterium]